MHLRSRVPSYASARQGEGVARGRTAGAGARGRTSLGGSRLVGTIASLGLLLGCGSADRIIESEVSYEAPTKRSIVVETVVDLPFDAAWSELIRRLSESSFHVSTLEKASSFVRVDLARSSDLAKASNKPSRYVDCGRTVRTYRETDSDEEGAARFEYAVADSSHYREADALEEGYRVSDIERRVDLEASATLFLQREGPRRTRVTVKSRYQVEIEISGQAMIVPRNRDEARSSPVSIGPRIESIRFTTFQPGRDDRQGGLTCLATGDFEHALIALANPAAAI